MNRYLEKIAKDGQSKPLQEHQSRSIEKLLANKGLILDHSTGSGKTRTLLEAIKRIQALESDGKQLVITPASLTSNIDKENKKHNLGLDNKRIETISYEKAINDIARLQKEKYSLIATDEGHKLRNTDTKRFKGLEELIGNAEHRLVMTATPMYNSPENISPLVNLVSGNKTLPTDKRKFEERYVSRKINDPGLFSQMVLGKKPGEEVKLTNKKELSKILNQYVDHYDVKDDPANGKHFPTKTEEIKEVPMSGDQERMYKYLEGNIPFLTRMKIRHGLPLDKRESANLNAFSSGVRQVSNSTKPFYRNGNGPVSPKIEMAVSELEKSMKKDKNHRGLVYSNYLEAGLNDYSKELSRKGIKHSLYHGGLTKTEKDAAVKAYNSGEIPNLLISTSGAEGLDLKGTKLIQSLEPHFNKSKIKQVVGRGVRYKSHDHLPENERHVTVQHYQSTFRPGMFGGKSKSKSIDQYLHTHSDDKEELVDQVKALMKNNKKDKKNEILPDIIK